MFKENLLLGKNAVITGAGRGIGQEIAVGFAKAGAKVSICSRSEQELKQTAKNIERDGGEVYWQTCDVAQLDDVNNFISFSVEKLGKIDILVINAGVNIEKKVVLDSNPDNWKRTIDINLMGAYYTAYAAVQDMIKHKNGKIIFVGSGKGHRGSPRGSAYACSKAGVWMLTRVLGEELEDYNIDVNEINPGPTISHMNTSFGSDIDSAFTSGKEWVKQPNDVVPLALFIASQPFRGPTQQSYSLTRRQVY